MTKDEICKRVMSGTWYSSFESVGYDLEELLAQERERCNREWEQAWRNWGEGQPFAGEYRNVPTVPGAVEECGNGALAQERERVMGLAGASVKLAVLAERERIAQKISAQPWQGALEIAEAIRRDQWDV